MLVPAQVFEAANAASKDKDRPALRLLHVERADDETVRAARMKLAKVYHPDAGTEPSHERMAAVNAAADAMLSR